MEITIARTYKNELQKKIAELLKEYEKVTGLNPEHVLVVRQSQYDELGNEKDYSFAVEVVVSL